MLKTSLAAMAFACVLAIAAPAGALPLKDTAAPLAFPAVTVKNLGPSRLLVAYNPGAALCGVQVFVRAGLDRQGRTQSGLAALTAESILRNPVEGSTLQDRITAAGGSITYAVEGQYTHFYVESAPAHMPQLLRLLTNVFAAPRFSPETVAAARDALGSRVDDLTHNPLAVGIATFKRSFYAASNAGLPELGSRVSLAALTPADVEQFYKATYRSGGALLTAVGDVPDELTPAAKELIAALPAGTPAPAASSGTTALDGTSKRLITHSAAHQTWLVFGFSAPPPGTRDFSTMLVLEALLSKSLDPPAVITAQAEERRFGSLYLYDSTPAAFALYANGLNVEPNAAINEINLTLAALSNLTFDQSAVHSLGATAQGLFLTESVSLVDQAWMIGNFALQGLSPQYASDALADVRNVTPADLRRVANQYLKKYTLAIILPDNEHVEQ